MGADRRSAPDQHPGSSRDRVVAEERAVAGVEPDLGARTGPSRPSPRTGRPARRDRRRERRGREPFGPRSARPGELDCSDAGSPATNRPGSGVGAAITRAEPRVVGSGVRERPFGQVRPWKIPSASGRGRRRRGQARRARCAAATDGRRATEARPAGRTARPSRRRAAAARWSLLSSTAPRPGHQSRTVVIATVP
jgi:hypothetical protein